MNDDAVTLAFVIGQELLRAVADGRLDAETAADLARRITDEVTRAEGA